MNSSYIGAEQVTEEDRAYVGRAFPKCAPRCSPIRTRRYEAGPVNRRCPSMM